MKISSPTEVIDMLRSPIHISRVGLWQYPISKLGHEEDESAMLGIDAINIKKLLLEKLPIGTRYSGLTLNRIIELLDNISNSEEGTDCKLIFNFDFLVSYLNFSDRDQLWDILLKGFPHKHKALLITIPEKAKNLLPVDNKLIIWSNEGRLI